MAARGAIKFDVPMRSSACRECGTVLLDYRSSGRLAQRCRPCKLAAKCAYQARTKPPVLKVEAECVDCGAGYVRSSKATRRVRCDRCRKAYGAAFRRNYAEKNPDIGKASRKKWADAHPEYLWNAAHRRRVLTRGSVDPFERIEIYERDGWVCQLCDQSVDQSVKFPDPWSASIDHVIPVVLGGDHTRANVVLAHLVCNQRKGARRG